MSKSVGRAWKFGVAVGAMLICSVTAAAQQPLPLAGDASSRTSMGTLSFDHGYSSAPVSGAVQKLDVSALMHAKEAVPLVRQGALKVVDLRSRGAFAKGSISGAINVAPHLLPTRDFLKDVPLLLVDEGYHTAALVRLRGELIGRGFQKVHVLFGGMQAWQRQNGDLSVAAVPPQEFFRVKDYSHWMVVDASGLSDVADSFSPAMSVSPKGEWQRKVVGAWERAGNRPFPPLLLVVGKDAESTAAIRARLAGLEKGVIPFVLEGGLENYRLFLQRQTLSWQGGKRTSQPSARCGY